MIAARRVSCFHDVTFARSNEGRPHALKLDGHYKLDSIGIKKSNGRLERLTKEGVGVCMNVFKIHYIKE